jgi:hypothetical protein
MKSIRGVLFFSLLFLFLVSIKSYSQSFEGKIVMQITSKDQDKPQIVDYYVKGNKIRVEAKGNEGESGAMIFDSKTSDMMIVMPSRKMYLTYNYKGAFGNVRDSISKAIEKGNVKMTDETKDINGFKCEKWIFKDDDGTTGEAWMTKGIRNFYFFNNPMRGNNDQPEWQKKLSNEGYFPMMVISKDKDGNLDSKMEVTSVDKTSLDASLFSAPADYKKMEMPMMPHGN